MKITTSFATHMLPSHTHTYTRPLGLVQNVKTQFLTVAMMQVKLMGESVEQHGSQKFELNVHLTSGIGLPGHILKLYSRL